MKVQTDEIKAGLQVRGMDHLEATFTISATVKTMKRIAAKLTSQDGYYHPVNALGSAMEKSIAKMESEFEAAEKVEE